MSNPEEIVIKNEPLIISFLIVVVFIIFIQFAKFLFNQCLEKGYLLKINRYLKTEFNAFDYEFFFIFIALM